MAQIKKHQRIVDGKEVAVRAHSRNRDGFGRIGTKARITKNFVRLRLRSPASLRKRGFTRFRVIEPDGKLPGIPKDVRELVIREKGKVVYAFKGDPSDGEGRAQAVLIPRRKR